MSETFYVTMAYSTQKVSTKLIDEIKDALHNISYGSIEIIVQAGIVTQITRRNIKKTSLSLREEVEDISLEETSKSGTIAKKKLSVKKIHLDN